MTSLVQLFAANKPALVLAPMQDVTDLAFWQLTMRRGMADLYFTEYFRVYPGSQLDKNILISITQNPTDQPVVAQIIGDYLPGLVRAAQELQEYPIASVDFNLGCPAPVVYRKNAGGGLLRDLDILDRLLSGLRQGIVGKFSIKTRLGFCSDKEFEALLSLYQKHKPDLLTIHGRTVKDGYRGTARYDWIAEAVKRMPCPIIVNGDINTHQKAAWLIQKTKASGVMVGRGAIANPWLFSQIRQFLAGDKVFQPTGGISGII